MLRKALIILSFICGIYGFHALNKFDDLPMKTKGIVVGYHVRDDNTKPIIEYKINRRQKQRLHLDVSFSPEFELKQKVTVKYDPDNPGSADVHHLTNSWQFAFGSMFLFMILLPSSFRSVEIDFD